MNTSAASLERPPLAPTGTLSRSMQLFRAFRVEQTDPDRFYGALASDSSRQLSPVVGPGRSDRARHRRWPRVLRRRVRRSGSPVRRSRAGCGRAERPRRRQGTTWCAPRVSSPPGRRPSASTSPSRATSSSTCPDPRRMAEEMLRVTRPGGVVFLSWTPWLSPWGGHETSPWHYLGGRRAADRYARRHDGRPKNDVGRSLFTCPVGPMVRWAHDAERAGRGGARRPARYHPWWAQWVMRRSRGPRGRCVERRARPAAAMKAEQGIWRIRLLTASLLVVALCFHQAPGLVVPDTKLDLTADPGNLLAKAMSIWDGNGFGQLQNQAYGYLFPIGPFHWVLDAIGLPSWVVQRLWWSTVLIVALWGFWRLSSALSIGTPWTRYLGAVLFALSPRFLSEVAITSIEVWPMALAPWVVLPLVDSVERRTISRLSRSALAFGLIGGVNAVATGATLVLPTLWFATRRWSGRMIGQFTAWLALCVAAALWWLVPLLVLGRHSPPFLDWIEDARVTTGTASAFNAIQGTTPWLGLLAQADGPSWPAAWQLVTQPLLIVLTGTLAVVGLFGLADRRVPERSWLLASLLVGLGLVTLGYSGTGSGPFVEQVHDVLDGPLAPLRNLHKFELVVRIPLLLGAVHALGVARPSAGRTPVATRDPGCVSRSAGAGRGCTGRDCFTDPPRWVRGDPRPLVPSRALARRPARRRFGPRRTRGILRRLHVGLDQGRTPPSLAEPAIIRRARRRSCWAPPERRDCSMRSSGGSALEWVPRRSDAR